MICVESYLVKLDDVGVSDEFEDVDKIRFVGFVQRARLAGNYEIYVKIQFFRQFLC